MSTAMQEWPRRHRITVDHYYRMAEAGLLGTDERVELINGEIVDMPPMGSAHAGTVEQLTALLSAAIGERAIVRAQLPVRLNEDSEPEPDIAVVKPRGDHYTTSHPAANDLLLIVEISDATLRFDKEVKIPLYARCGIPEAWIVDLRSARVEVYRAPSDGRYTSVAAEAPGKIEIGSLPGAVVELSVLQALQRGRGGTT